jgi:hypothetical protein
MIQEFLEIIQEGRKEDFVSRYKNKFSPETLNRMVSLIKPKYLDWVGRAFDGTNFEDNFRKLQSSLKRFDEISSNLTKTDIFQYKSLGELVNEIEKYDSRNRRSVQIADDTNLVYDDGRFVVVNPLTHDASCLYGKGTKWCTTASTPDHFKKYNEDGKLFYIIDRKLKQDDPQYKIALLKKFEGDEFLFDAQNNQFKKGWILDTDVFNKINEAIKKYLNKEFEEQIKIFSDKELARKERERTESLRIRRRYMELEAEAEDRRVENEWSLSNPDIDEEGMKANALLEWLESNSDVEVLTSQDLARLSELKINLETLRERETELEQAGEDTDDLSDEIETIEEEIEELENKVDVYVLVPIGGYYSGTEFEAINGDLQGRRYAVFTEREIQDSCEEYLDGLIDDIGIEGINASFAREYLDTEKIVEEAQEVYDDDVSNNPEVYLEDSDRELSNSQERLIEYNKRKIEAANQLIEELEEIDDENVSTSEKIEELQDQISELEDEIQDIEDNPDGEYKQDAIDEKVEDLVYDVRRNPEWFLNEMGLEWTNYVDKDELIKGMIDADGYGHTLNGYDGNADEVDILGNTFWVMRID